MQMNKGRIVQVVGPVVDVAFNEPLPRIHNALTAEYKTPDGPVKLTLEVQENNHRARGIYTAAGFARMAYVPDAGGSLFFTKPLV